MVRLFTIGFTKKSAADFFGRLEAAGVRRVIDTRLNNTSQLSAFAKQPDLEYFLKRLDGIDYEHQLPLAPTKEILDAYKKKQMSWQDYEKNYLALIKNRSVESQLDIKKLENSCLLCSEDTPHHCHRRLAAEYLQRQFKDLEIVHL
ncbi:MAG: hypothetical protein RLZZ490_1308 [Cyanobacteriota bacterium]|jgi:uncharacterized protein (DUF488 family)